MLIIFDKKKILAISLLIIFSLMFIIAIYLIIMGVIEADENNKLNYELIRNTKIEETSASYENNKEESFFINVDFNDLLKINNDVKGWISFGYINNVFVQGSNNDYYLKRTIKKEYNQYGTLFLDYRNELMSNKNTIIYGHNSDNMSMFGSLKLLLNQEYFENTNNDIINISTPTANYNYQIFSVYNIEKEDYYINTKFTSYEFTEFIDIITKRSYYYFDLSVDVNDRILTLSTCYGVAGTNIRTVVHAKLIGTMNR